MTETKKDFSTAILDKKKAPHKLTVEDSKQDDNSIVEMTQAKMDELKIFKGDTVMIRGKLPRILLLRQPQKGNDLHRPHV